MTSPSNADKYLLDTSALVEFEDFFTPENWQPVWDFLYGLGDSGKILIIDDVYLELERRFKDYQITKWAKSKRSKLHLEYTEAHFKYLEEVVLVQCNCIDEKSTSAVFADPLLLAVAGCDGYTLVTHEHRKEGLQAQTRPENINIPNHCETLKISNVLYGPHVWKHFLEKERFSLMKKELGKIPSQPLVLKLPT